MQDEKMTYEEAMARLDVIAREMEGGVTGIDEMAARLQEAQELVRFCQEKLLEAEKNCKSLLSSGENV